MVVVAFFTVAAHAIASPGDLDSTFSTDGLVTTEFEGDSGSGIEGLAIQPDGKIVASGFAANGFAVARYLQGGELDPSFSGDGRVSTDFGRISGPGQELVLQPDGRIVVVGGRNGVLVARYLEDGPLDPSFSGNGYVRATRDGSGQGVALQPDGRIVVAGAIGLGPSLVRLLPDGQPDPTFGQAGVIRAGSSGWFNSVAVQPDGKILAAGGLIGGCTPNFGCASEALLFRFLPDGTLDPSFSEDGKVIDSPTSARKGDPSAFNDVAVAPDGSIYAAGNYDRPLSRWHEDGTLDQSFLGSTAIHAARDLGFGPSDEALVGGVGGYSVAPAADRTGLNFGVTVPTMQGTKPVATDFATSQDIATGIAVQADGKVVVAGAAWIEGGSLFGLARYEVDDGPPDADADLVRDPEDHCPYRYGAWMAGCPRSPRTLSLSYEGKAQEFEITLEAAYRECEIRRRVRLFAVRRGQDRLIDSFGSGFGTRAKEVAVERGRYYAKTKAHFSPYTGKCSSDRSPTISVARSAGPTN